ncbi:MAG: signal peptidase II [Pseudomonadota bacterium]
MAAAIVLADVATKELVEATFAHGEYWPAFNVADIGITLGAAALILDAMFIAPRKGASQRAPR